MSSEGGENTINVKNRARVISKRIKVVSKPRDEDDDSEQNGSQPQKRRLRPSVRGELTLKQRVANLETDGAASAPKKKTVRVRKSVRKSVREGPDDEMRRKFHSLAADKNGEDDSNALKSSSTLQPDANGAKQRPRESVRMIKTSLSTRRRAFLAAQNTDPDKSEANQSEGKEKDAPVRKASRRIRVKSIKVRPTDSNEKPETTENRPPPSFLAQGQSRRIRASQVRRSAKIVQEGTQVQNATASLTPDGGETGKPGQRPGKLRMSRIVKFNQPKIPASDYKVGDASEKPMGARKVSVRRVRRSIRTAPAQNSESKDETETRQENEKTPGTGKINPNSESRSSFGRKSVIRISRRVKPQSTASSLALPGQEADGNESTEPVAVGKPRKLRMSKYVKVQDKQGTVRRVLRASARHSVPLADRIKAFKEAAVEEKKPEEPAPKAQYRKKYLDAYLNEADASDGSDKDGKPVRRVSKRIVRKSMRSAPSLRTRAKQLKQSQTAPDEGLEEVKQKRLDEAVEAITRKPVPLPLKTYHVIADSDNDELVSDKSYQREKDSDFQNDEKQKEISAAVTEQHSTQQVAPIPAKRAHKNVIETENTVQMVADDKMNDKLPTEDELATLKSHSKLPESEPDNAVSDEEPTVEKPVTPEAKDETTAETISSPEADEELAKEKPASHETYEEAVIETPVTTKTNEEPTEETTDVIEENEPLEEKTSSHEAKEEPSSLETYEEPAKEKTDVTEENEPTDENTASLEAKEEPEEEPSYLETYDESAEEKPVITEGPKEDKQIGLEAYEESANETPLTTTAYEEPTEEKTVVTEENEEPTEEKPAILETYDESEEEKQAATEGNEESVDEKSPTTTANEELVEENPAISEVYKEPKKEEPVSGKTYEEPAEEKQASPEAYEYSANETPFTTEAHEEPVQEKPAIPATYEEPAEEQLVTTKAYEEPADTKPAVTDTYEEPGKEKSASGEAYQEVEEENSIPSEVYEKQEEEKPEAHQEEEDKEKEKITPTESYDAVEDQTPATTDDYKGQPNLSCFEAHEEPEQEGNKHKDENQESAEPPKPIPRRTQAQQESDEAVPIQKENMETNEANSDEALEMNQSSVQLSEANQQNEEQAISDKQPPKQSEETQLSVDTSSSVRRHDRSQISFKRASDPVKEQTETSSYPDVAEESDRPPKQQAEHIPRGKLDALLNEEQLSDVDYDEEGGIIINEKWRKRCRAKYIHTYRQHAKEAREQEDKEREAKLLEKIRQMEEHPSYEEHKSTEEEATNTETLDPNLDKAEVYSDISDHLSDKNVVVPVEDQELDEEELGSEYEEEEYYDDEEDYEEEYEEEIEYETDEEVEYEEDEEIGSDEEVVYVDEDGNYVDADGNPIDEDEVEVIEEYDDEEEEDGEEEEVIYMDEDGNYVDEDGNIIEYEPDSDDEIIEE